MKDEKKFAAMVAAGAAALAFMSMCLPGAAGIALGAGVLCTFPMLMKRE